MKMILRRLFVFTCLLISGCGGGSEGTGTKSISGSVKFDDGAALSQALITVLETGDSATTDDAGFFLIETQTDASSINLSVEKEDLNATTTITGLDQNDSNVRVDLTVRRGDASLISVGYLEIWARIDGECANYFNNSKIIKQNSSVPDNLRCTLRFFASGDGRPLERIRGHIDVRSCDSDTWRNIAEGLTGTGPTAGFGDIDFDYIDNRQNCEYRLLAPINDPQQRSFEIYIQTLTLQNRD